MSSLEENAMVAFKVYNMMHRNNYIFVAYRRICFFFFLNYLLNLFNYVRSKLRRTAAKASS